MKTGKEFGLPDHMFSRVMTDDEITELYNGGMNHRFDLGVGEITPHWYKIEGTWYHCVTTERYGKVCRYVNGILQQ
jgi:hypothetical protein